MVTRKKTIRRRRHPVGVAYPDDVLSWLDSEFLLQDVHDYCINRATCTLFLHGNLNAIASIEGTMFSEPGVEFSMANMFVKNIHLLSSRDPNGPILVRMNTIGGDWDQGMAIHDSILTCPNPVTILVYAAARSMSSIILQAADKRVMMPNSKFMFHFGSYNMGEVKNEGHLDTEYRIQKRDYKTMIDIYVKRMQQKGSYKDWSANDIREFIREKIRENTDAWFYPNQAVKLGLADTVFNGNWKTLRAKRKISH